jgi:hypothetical protein
MASASQQFIVALEPHRDALYARALASSASAAAAESALIAAIRKAFASALSQQEADPVPAIAATLAEPAAPIAAVPMPADTWARVTAAIQVEAAQSGTGLAEGHVLLKPDPMLAPKKIKRTAYKAGLAPAYRFIIAAAVVATIAVALTIYIMRAKS